MRVFLIITIALYHMRIYLNRLHLDFFTDMYNMLDGGRNGVEAFFIISGFFLILTFKNFLGKIYQNIKIELGIWAKILQHQFYFPHLNFLLSDL